MYVMRSDISDRIIYS